MANPSVSVIVTARNEQKTVDRCLSALLSQDYPDYRILFVDAGSMDDTLKIAKNKAAENSILEIAQFEGNPSQCRNMAVKVTKSDVIAFTDADVEVPRNWLSQTVSTLLSRPEIGGVGGPNHPTREQSSDVMKIVDLILTTSLGSMRSAQSYDFKQKTIVKSIPCCNATYSRQLFMDIGGFDEGLVGCDDTDLGYRITRSGREIVFDPAAKVLHRVKFQTLKQFARLMFKYGRGRGYASKRKRYLFSGPAIPAALLLVCFPLLVIVAFTWSVLPLALVLLCYVVGIVAYSIGIGVTRKSAMASLLAPIVLTVEYASYFIGFFAGLIDRRSSRWSN